MFDIICCEAEPSKFGFDRFYFYKNIKISEVENLSEAAQYKNKKLLLRLRDHAFDEGMIKVIAEKKKACFLIDLGKIIQSSGVPRAIAISKLRTFLGLCAKHGAYYTFASFAKNENEIRTPDEICHIAMLFGLNNGQAKFALKMLQHY